MFIFYTINRFDCNEWFVIITLIVGITTAYLLPRKYSREAAFIFFLWGVAVPTIFDFTIGGGKYDFYRVNDSNRYEITDYLTYLMFGPISYIFFYIYETLKLNKKTQALYALANSIFAISLERIMVICGVFTYQHGYKVFFSFTIYLFMSSITISLYEWIKSKHSIYNEKNNKV